MHNLKDLFCLVLIEILCTNLRDFWSKNGGLLSINVFWTHPPAGGAITGQCDNSGSEVQLWHPGSVHVKFRWCHSWQRFLEFCCPQTRSDTRTDTRMHGRTRAPKVKTYSPGGDKKVYFLLLLYSDVEVAFIELTHPKQPILVYIGSPLCPLKHSII